MTNRLVSIIMPAYNAEQYINQSIESVLKQTYFEWELIIIDDASTDSTSKIISKWCVLDSRIRTIKNSINCGLGYTTNIGLQSANGAFIAKLDSDDFAEKDWLSTRIEFLNNNLEINAVSGSRILVNEKGELIRKLYEDASINICSFKIMFGNCIVHPGIVFRNSKLLFYKNIRYFEDWSLWGNPYFKNKILMLNDHLINYRIHQNNTSKSVNYNNEFTFQIHSIINNQLIQKLNLEVSNETSFILYRNRRPLCFKKKQLNDAVKKLIEISNLFKLKYINNDSNCLNEFHIAVYDEFFHIARKNNGLLKYFFVIYMKFPVSPLIILFNKKWRKLSINIFFKTKYVK